MRIAERPRPIRSSLIEDSAPRRLAHGFFTREGGYSDGVYRGLNVGIGSNDDPERVQRNRASVAETIGVAPDRLLTPYQVHSPDVVTVSDTAAGERPRADGIVTATPGIAVGVVTADCGPVLFADAEAGVIGAAHAGWRGALAGVLDNTIAAMEALGASRERIVATLGPTISQANYEVGPEFQAQFVGQNSGHAVYFTGATRSGHWMFDLPRFIIDRLAAAGVRADQLGHCTYADEEHYFSFRRTTHRGEPDYGRQISAIALLE